MKTQWLPSADYAQILAAQFEAVEAVRNGHAGIILGTEHQPCITLGRRNKDWSPAPTCQIPHYSILRGGLATYHGPGQATIYPIIKLEQYGLGIRRWADLIEQATISTLNELNVDAHIRPNCPGVYSSKGKIASIGFHILEGVSMHGVSVLVKQEHAGFQHIDPCGVPNQALSSIENERGQATEVKAFGVRLIEEIKKRLQT